MRTSSELVVWNFRCIMTGYQVETVAGGSSVKSPLRSFQYNEVNRTAENLQLTSLPHTSQTI